MLGLLLQMVGEYVERFKCSDRFLAGCFAPRYVQPSQQRCATQQPHLTAGSCCGFIYDGRKADGASSPAAFWRLPSLAVSLSMLSDSLWSLSGMLRRYRGYNLLSSATFTVTFPCFGIAEIPLPCGRVARISTPFPRAFDSAPETSACPKEGGRHLGIQVVFHQ